MYAFREGGKAHPRVLYWFRTPPNVRVGRAALDEEAIRVIEERHPDLTFDWTHMLKTAPAPAAVPGAGRERRRSQGRPGPPPSRERAAQAPPEERVVEAPPAATELPASDWIEEGGQPGTGFEVVEPAEAPRPAAHHVETRIGREGLDRLRARYAALLARISERVTDQARLEELRTQAERLNPDTWVTDDEARHGIEQFDALYETLRGPLGHRRRRRRGGARHRRGQACQGEHAPAGPSQNGSSKDPDPSE